MKRNRRSLSAYGVATILSLIAHVSFLALLEGVLLLTEIRSNVPRQARILFETRQFHTPERTPSSRSRFNVTYGKKSYPRSAVKIQGAQRNHVQKDRLANKAQWQGWFQSFDTNQADLDRRIVKIRERLDALRKDNEIPSIYVSDAGDVPRDHLGAWREGRVKSYLTQMRSKIRSSWLKKVSSQNIRPGVVTIGYRIHSSGDISDLETVLLEGDRSFYRACLAAIEESSPFGPLPIDLVQDHKESHLRVKLTFYLRGFDRHENVTPVA